MQFIDLSVPLETNKSLGIKVKYQSHRSIRFLLWRLFGLRKKHLKTGLGWAMDHLKLFTHSTTHLDAPWHYAPFCEGKPSKTIDQIPLEWCFGDGVVIDMRHKENFESINADDLHGAVKKMNYNIQPMNIVLIMTGNDRYLGTPEYGAKGSGLSADGTRWILDQGVKVAGIDSWGWDLPLPYLAKKAKGSHENGVFWEAHYVGTEKEYCHMEHLTNLDKLPPFGFKVCCFPIKVKSGSGAPIRAVAIIED